LFAVTAPQWIIGILAFTHLGGGPGPQVAWGWLIAGWLLFASAPGGAVLVLVARRLLIGRLTPGRYPRHGWLTYRIWFVERLGEVCHLDRLAGTPWAPFYARISGVRLGSRVRLGTLPPPTSLVAIGDGATIEADVDLHGWWIDGYELVVEEIRIGAGASVGTRSLLMPGAQIGVGAEIDPGSVITGIVPDGERWAGSPGRRVGVSGEGWPAQAPPRPRHARSWNAMYGLGLGILTVLPLAAIVPGLLIQAALDGGGHSLRSLIVTTLLAAPLIALSFLATYGLLVVVLVRLVSPFVRPGWHAETGVTPWALWFTELTMAGARGILFPLYATVYTRSWLRMLGVKVGRRTEISTAAGLNRLVSFADTSFAADDVSYTAARARNGWVSVSPITVGSRTFLGNGAIVPGASRIGNDSLIGVLSTAPLASADGSSWLGAPAIELPRVPDKPDASRTTNPPARLILARGSTELARILLPGTVSVALASVVYLALDTVGRAAGLAAMVAVAPFALLAAGLGAAAVTIAAKWLLVGRYRPGEHPLWSSFVWRDEIINTCQEQLAGPWLLHHALATPLLPAYLRAMGAKVGADVWFETLNVTEFDVVSVGDGAVINRHACLQTHLFHDRLMRIGPTTIGAGATLGPSTAVLPNTTIGAGSCVGGRSVVMRGEELPRRTRWHGTPVVAA
jgi:non-ribosomal peptide synthetase-like protein